jgi:hypothetical protein
MIVDDIAYGRIGIKNRLILDLINSRAVQRLRGIHQHGSWKYIFPHDHATRLDHSIGVFHLLRHFRAGLEEQAAGLIHDVPHTAFSHVIDYVYDQRETMEYHEGLHERVVMNSDIAGILESHGMDARRITDHANFPLLERPIPDLCCDRLDYFFRDAVQLGICSREDIGLFIKQLVVRDNEIVCSEPAAAKEMAIAYLECSERWWASPLQAASFELMAMAIKAGLERGFICEYDLMLTDDEVYGKLMGSGDGEITKRLGLVRPDLKVEVNPGDYDFFTRTKARFIDPKVLAGGVERVSGIYPDFRERIKGFRERIAKGYHIKILSP